MFSPQRLLEILKSFTDGSSKELVAFWYKVEGSRTDFAGQIRATRGNAPVVPLIPRVGFTNPNAVLSDLARLCEDNRQAFDESLFAATPPLVLLILGANDLGVAQLSSPALLPEWMPWCGGKNCWVTLESLNHIAEGSLNAPEVAAGELAEALYRLEGALLKRIAASAAQNHNHVSALFDTIKREGEKLEPFLEACRTFIRSVEQPSGYRPSVKAANSLLARLIMLMSKNSPDDLTRPARALATALAISSSQSIAMAKDVPDSMPAVLLRSTSVHPDPLIRLGKNLLVTVYAASQLVTASAHAAEYPRYPLQLLASVSRDLRVTLQDFTTAVDDLQGGA